MNIISNIHFKKNITMHAYSKDHISQKTIKQKEIETDL